MGPGCRGKARRGSIGVTCCSGAVWGSWLPPSEMRRAATGRPSGVFLGSASCPGGGDGSTSPFLLPKSLARETGQSCSEPRARGGTRTLQERREEAAASVRLSGRCFPSGVTTQAEAPTPLATAHTRVCCAARTRLVPAVTPQVRQRQVGVPPLTSRGHVPLAGRRSCSWWQPQERLLPAPVTRQPPWGRCHLARQSPVLARAWGLPPQSVTPRPAPAHLGAGEGRGLRAGRWLVLSLTPEGRGLQA